MIDSSWKRIAGMHVQEDGEMAIVWLAHDKLSDVVHLYDSCAFKNEVPVVIAEGLNARGRWIPIAWEKSAKNMADSFLERGCKMLPEPSNDSDQLAEVLSREIQERMRTGRFKVDKRLKDWIDEFDSFEKIEGKVPRGNSPFMSATRHAIAQLKSAKKLQNRSTTLNYPKVSII